MKRPKVTGIRSLRAPAGPGCRADAPLHGKAGEPWKAPAGRPPDGRPEPAGGCRPRPAGGPAGDPRRSPRAEGHRGRLRRGAKEAPRSPEGPGRARGGPGRFPHGMVRTTWASARRSPTRYTPPSGQGPSAAWCDRSVRQAARRWSTTRPGLSSPTATTSSYPRPKTSSNAAANRAPSVCPRCGSTVSATRRGAAPTTTRSTPGSRSTAARTRAAVRVKSASAPGSPFAAASARALRANRRTQRRGVPAKSRRTLRGQRANVTRGPPYSPGCRRPVRAGRDVRSGVRPRSGQGRRRVTRGSVRRGRRSSGEPSNARRDRRHLRGRQLPGDRRSAPTTAAPRVVGRRLPPPRRRPRPRCPRS